MNPSFFQALVENGVWILPHLLVLGVGSALVWQLKDRNPTAATFALAAFALMGFTALAGTLLTSWYFQAAYSGAPGKRAQLSTIYGVLNALKAVINLAAWGLLIASLRRALLGPESRS